MMMLKRIKIFSDQTKMQRDNFKRTKQQVDEMVVQGDNKNIIYINGIPTIVDANPAKK